MATSPRVRAFFSFSFPFFANALAELLSNAAPGARRAAPIPIFLRNDRLASRLGAGEEFADGDDSLAAFAPFWPD